MFVYVFIRGKGCGCSSFVSNLKIDAKFCRIVSNSKKTYQGATERLKEADVMRVREVPIAWYGNAQEVRVMVSRIFVCGGGVKIRQIL